MMKINKAAVKRLHKAFTYLELKNIDITSRADVHYLHALFLACGANDEMLQNINKVIEEVKNLK